MPAYQKLKTVVKRSTDQKLRLRIFDARNESLETGAVVTSRRGLSGIERGKGIWQPTQGLAGDVPRIVITETLVMCTTAQETRRTSQKTSGGCDQTVRLKVTCGADDEQDEARGRSQHRRFSSPHSHNGQERFPSMTIKDELLQMIEKMSEKPDKERTITTARARPRWLSGNTRSPTR